MRGGLGEHGVCDVPETEACNMWPAIPKPPRLPIPNPAVAEAPVGGALPLGGGAPVPVGRVVWASRKGMPPGAMLKRSLAGS